MSRKTYSSDLSEAQWRAVEPFVARPDPRGNPGKYEKREVVNAILYVAREGCRWRALPGDLPPWEAVYDHFRRWRQRGVWESLAEELARADRRQAGRNPEPSVGIVDSQSVRARALGRSAAFMVENSSKAARAMLLPTQLAGCLRCGSPPPARATPPRQAPCSPRQKSAMGNWKPWWPTKATKPKRKPRPPAWGKPCRLSKKRGSKGLPNPPVALGHRAHLRLVWELPTPFQGLRAHGQKRRSLFLDR